jgi:hypothetical protein
MIEVKYTFANTEKEILERNTYMLNKYLLANRKKVKVMSEKLFDIFFANPDLRGISINIKDECKLEDGVSDE